MSDKSLISLQSVASENRYSMKIIRAFWEVVCQAAFNVMMHLENHCCLSLHIHRSIASKHHDPEGMVENGVNQLPPTCYITGATILSQSISRFVCHSFSGGRDRKWRGAVGEQGRGRGRGWWGGTHQTAVYPAFFLILCQKKGYFCPPRKVRD